ncbi:ubiquinol-cytochrome C chaperone-domain-containing protein [Melampsora americana]|nr:ubiquinol-cytochrome C chaperone-domain-containing protein [Melampsora americana]
MKTHHQLIRINSSFIHSNQIKPYFSLHPSHQTNSFLSSTYHQVQTKSFSTHQIKLNSTSTSTSTSNSYHIGKSGKRYSPWLVKVLVSLGNGLGYHLPKSHAITVTSDLYDHCSNQFELEKPFWINQCGLPDSFQTWFQITQLHLWILIVRLRCMKSNLGQLYIQELVNHTFIDIEHRMRSKPYKVTKNRLIKGYMKTMLDQHYGFLIGFDWALAIEKERSDQILTEAIWRNLFGAEWGKGMGGVKGIFESHQTKDDEKRKESDLKNGKLKFEDEIEFMKNLKLINEFIRIELIRVSKLSDEEIMNYQTKTSNQIQVKNPLIKFGKILNLK